MTASPTKGNPNNIHYQELNIFETEQVKQAEALWMDIYKGRLKDYVQLKERKKEKARVIMQKLKIKYGYHFTTDDLTEFDKHQFVSARRTLMMF